MNQDVPQPMTQTSWPAAGSTPSSSAASSAARAHSDRLTADLLRSDAHFCTYNGPNAQKQATRARIWCTDREQNRSLRPHPRAARARRVGRTSATLAGDLGVSEATVRRDLQVLGEQRLLERSHGGAVAHGTAHELPVRYRTGRSDEKQRIARAAAELVADGQSVGLTGGTTTTEVARVLAPRSDLTVVTNALNIAAELAVRPNLKLIVTGGVARSASYELVGPLADGDAAGHQRRSRLRRRRRDRRRARDDDPERGRGGHQPRADRARRPHRRGGRRLQARARGVRLHRGARRGRRAADQRRRGRRRRSSGCATRG